MMMDRNREARRAAAMSNGGLQRRRHRPNAGGLRDSDPGDDGPLDLQEAARLRDRTAKRDRDRDVRDKDRQRVDRDRERDRLNRSKRRRGGDDGGAGGGGGGDDSSEESVTDEDDEDVGPPPQPPQPSMRYVPPPNPGPVSSSSSPASTAALGHRRSYPPPTKMFRSTVAPTWKAPDEIIGFSIPRKARSASTKRSHDCWTSSSIGGDHILRQQSPSLVMSATTATANSSASPLAAPMSPSSSNISIKKKLKPNGGSKPKGVPKPSPKSSPLIQEEIEIEVAEVLYGLMRQSHAPSTSKLETENGSTKIDRSISDSKSSISPPPFTTVAPKRKRPRPYPEENPKAELDQALKSEAAAPLGSTVDNGGLSGTNPVLAVANGVASEGMKVEEESKGEEIAEVHHGVESTSTSAKPNSTFGEKTHREEKFEIDLMAPPPPSRGSPEGEAGEEYGEKRRDDKSLVTDREAEAELKEEESEKGRGKKSSSENVELNVNRAEGEVDADDSKTNLKAVIPDGGPHKQQELHLQSQHHTQPLVNLNTRDHCHNLDLHLDLDKFDNHKPLSKAATAVKDEPHAADTKPGGGQSSSMPMPMSVPAGWHGGLGPMGYVAPLQGVVSMDSTPMASPPMQPPHFMFSQPKQKRCATHCCIARSISVHQQMLKMQHPFWPAAAAAAGSAPLFGGKPPYNMNMVPPSADLRGSSQDKGQPFAFFPGQPASKDKSPLTPNVPDSSHKKQFLLPQNLPPGAPTNVLPAPAFFFPFGQQQAAAAAAAAASGRPGTINPPSTGASSASTPASSVAPAGASSTAPSVAGPAMTFSYPNMAGNETQFMAILGNSPYPFPIPAHVGGSTSYRGSQPPQAMPFFNGSFYSSQMLHPSQLQQQPPPMGAAQSLQIQPQNHQNPSISTSSSSSQKHLQNQQQRLQGNTAMAPNSNLQNSQPPKNRPSQPQPHHEVGSEDSPSTADSRTRPNLSVYGQNFAMPFHSPNFALLAPSSSVGGGGGGGGGSNAAGVPNGNHSDKKQQQQLSQQQHQPAFPMSFASSVKGGGGAAPGLDISSMANNPAIMQSLPEAVRHNYQIMAAAAQAAQAQAQAQAANQRKNVADPSGGEEERRAMASRTSAAPPPAAGPGQSIAFSRDLGDNSSNPTMPGNSVVDSSSARTVNLVPGSNRPARSSGPNALANSSVSNPQQHQHQQQQQQQQMLFPKQQQFVAATVAAARSKTPSTASNGGAYPDHLTSKFPNNMPNFPLAQSSGTPPSQSSQWKSSVRPNTSQVSSPPVATSSITPTIKNLPQQQGRPQHQQNHTQISFSSAAANPKPSPTSQGQHASNSNQLPSSPMMVGSPSSSSVSKSGGVSSRTVTSSSTTNKAGPQQGKNPSTSLSSQKPSILGSPHMMSTSNSSSKPQSQEPQQQQPQLSKQSIQQAQLFFSNAYMQASANTSAGGGYYLQRHRPENQQQQQQQASKPQGSAPSTSSGMLSLCPVSLANTGTSDPAKAAAAAAAANSMKGSLPPQGMFHAAQFAAAQSAAGAHQLVSAGFPYVHATSTSVQIKPAAEQKQPAVE